MTYPQVKGGETRVSEIVQGVQWHSMAQGSTFWVKTITKLAVCYYKKLSDRNAI